MKARREPVKRIASVVSVAIAIVLMSGCLGYRVGTLLPADIKTIYVPTFKNRTGERNLEIQATNAVIDQLNRDGTLIVVSKQEDADSMVEVTIVEYQRKAVRYRDVTDPAEYRVTIVTRATFTDLTDNKVFWKDKRISGEAEFEIGGSLPASERRALPRAFEDLGKDIVDAIVEGWN
jgi:hypothetical protein